MLVTELHDAIFGAFDMIEETAATEERQVSALERVRNAYSLRIKELKGYALEDEIEVIPASEQDFWAFVDSLSSNKRPASCSATTGIMKAVWKDTGANHLGIQFLGNKRGEYVIFKRRQPRASEISRVAGIDTLQGIKNQMAAFDIIDLVND